MFEYIWILLPLGLLIGWLAAKKDANKKQRLLHYLSLRYFLEDDNKGDPKNVLMDLPLSNDDEGIRFSLTLGDAFRRRGEIDRAITLHEYVFNASEMDKKVQSLALKSLAEDFLTAGLLDRAESTLRALIDYDEYKDDALLKLAHIYEQQRDWLQAIASLERIENSKETHAVEIAHLYCELAESTLIDYKAAYSWADQALLYDPHCARASLIKGYLALEAAEYREALEYLQQIESQQASLTPLIVPVVYRIMQQINPLLFKEWLDRQLEKREAHMLLHLWKTHLYVLEESVDEAIDYLQQRLEKRRNLQGLLLLNNLLELSSDNHFYPLYHEVFNEVVDHYAKFRCDKCGFVTKILNWSCPSCQSWNTGIPVSDIIALQKSA